MKVITIFGRVTKDCEVRQTDTGKFVTFSVAVNEGYKENQTAIFFDVAYNREGIAPYVTKGKQVTVHGDFKTSVLNELSQQSINKITINELNNAKARIKANNVYKFDSVFYQAMQVGMLETKGISWENLDNYNSIVESITLDEVLKAGEIYFSNDRLLTTVLRPKK